MKALKQPIIEQITLLRITKLLGIYIGLAVLSATFITCGSKTTKEVVEFQEDLPPGDSVGTKNDGGSKSRKEEEYFEKFAVSYEDQTYNKQIKTVQLYGEGWELSPPFIRHGSDNSLVLNFDDLAADVKDYRFTIIHCTYDWQPSDMLPGDYLTGFHEDYISQHEFSVNTLIKYTRYTAKFPNANIQITKSGNYIVRVHDAADPDKTVFTRRFFVFEDAVNVEPRFRRPIVFEDKNYRQEIDFTIFHHGFNLPNPYTDLHVVLRQNQRWDNAVWSLQPLYVKDGELVYDYDSDNVFDGGNEFRQFDLKSLKFLNRDIIESAERDSGFYRVRLVPDKRRSIKQYLQRPDINGNFFIRNAEGIGSILDADYVQVDFRLPYGAPITDGNLYVFGALSDWKFRDEFQLHYNYEAGWFETSVQLKQGYYDYMYVFVEDGKSKGDLSFIEGTHFEAENEYSILVYYVDPILKYDRLLAWKSFKTRS